jgi:hypothetical protein
VWLATPSPYGSFIHDTLPVFPALSGRTSFYHFKSTGIRNFFSGTIFTPHSTDWLAAD